MLAGVGLLSVCCISSSLLAGAMGGGGETVEETVSTEAAPLPKGRYVRLEHTVAHDANAEGNDDDKHKIINKGKTDLEILEVQTGLKISENDIIRYDDIYGRK